MVVRVMNVKYIESPYVHPSIAANIPAAHKANITNPKIVIEGLVFLCL